MGLEKELEHIKKEVCSMILFFDSTYWKYELLAVVILAVIAYLAIKHKN